MKKMETVCIMCPMGCPLSVVADGDNVTVSGNTCKRGEVYGRQELIAPQRVVTSLIRLAGGGVVSVKTDRPVPKESVFRVLDELKRVEAVLPVSIDDVVIENVLGTGANVVVTCNKK